MNVVFPKMENTRGLPHWNRPFLDFAASLGQWVLAWSITTLVGYHLGWFYIYTYGYGSIPINTIFSGMNIHLPAILMFTRGTRFWHCHIYIFIYTLYYPGYIRIHQDTTDISVGSVMFYRHVGRNAHSLEAWDRFPSLRKRLRPKPRLQQLRGMVLVCSSITISISIGRSDT